MLNQKSLLISLAVLAAFTITSTGCGKSKESRSDVRGTTVTQQGDAQNVDQLPEQPAEGEDQAGVGQLPPTVIDGVKELPKSTDSGNLTGEGGTVNPLPKSGEDKGSVDLPQSGKDTKKSNSAVSAKFDEAEAVKTGGKLEALNFTSAGNDGLMTEFRSYNNKVAAEQKTKNLNVAKAVLNAKLKRSTSAGSLLVDLTLDESMDGVKKITSYRLQGNPSQAGDRQILKQVNTNGDLEYQGGFLKCIDTDGGCENAYIKIKLSGAYVRIIFRNSFADRFFILEQGSQGSSFELWKTYLMNTTNMSTTSQKLANIKTSAFEVVNGRAAMGVLITAEDNEMVGLSVPLLVADKGTVAGSNISKVNDISKNYDLASSSNASQNLAQAIREAKLVNNNGKGDLRIRLDLSAGTQKGAMWLTLSSLQKATMSTAEISSFESKIPNF